MAGQRLGFTGDAMKPPLGLQLWSLKHLLEKDLPGTLKQIKAWGIDEVESAGFYGRTAAEFAAELKNAGLKCHAMHIKWDAFDNNLSGVIKDAEALGATISCSRPVVDKKWLPKERQVGTSGKTVKPKVYIALGISGAFQHVAGMKNAGTIIAVNKDPKAPIFNVADYGIVEDLFKILPVLTEKLKAS